MVCPLCGGASRRRFMTHEIWIRDCDACRHRFAEFTAKADHVERIYGDDYFAQGGAGYPGYLDEGPLLREGGRSYARLLERTMRPGTVLDIGSAAGFWLQGLVDCGWVGRGIEPNAAMAAHARSLGLAVETGALEQRGSAEQVDLVAMIQVVSHFADARGALVAAVDRIRPGGFLLVETWDRKSWAARLFGRRWHEYSPPSVLHWFSRRSLAELGGQLGLREVARGRPRKRISVRQAKSLLRYKLESSALGRRLVGALGVIPDGLVLPYLADDLFWMLLERPRSTSQPEAQLGQLGKRAR